MSVMTDDFDSRRGSLLLNKPEFKGHYPRISVTVIPTNDPVALFDLAYDGYMKGAGNLEGGVRGVLRALGLIDGPEQMP